LELKVAPVDLDLAKGGILFKHSLRQGQGLEEDPLGRDGKFDFVPVKIIAGRDLKGHLDAVGPGKPGLDLKGLFRLEGLAVGRG
jgi:hypothetical protein